MIAPSLRLRLILAFSALVSLVLFVDISGIDWKRLGVEFEGYWNSPGAFIATQVSEVPELKYPKLRGRIQSVAPDAKSFTMYGLSIR